MTKIINPDYFSFAGALSKLAAAQIDVSDLAFEEERERRHEQNIRTIGRHESAEDCRPALEEEEDGNNSQEQ